MAKKQIAAKSTAKKALPVKEKKLTLSDAWKASSEDRSWPRLCAAMEAFPCATQDQANKKEEEVDNLFQDVFGAAARPEHRVVVARDELIEIFETLRAKWSKASGTKAAANKLKREEKEAAKKAPEKSQTRNPTAAEATDDGADLLADDSEDENIDSEGGEEKKPKKVLTYAEEMKNAIRGLVTHAYKYHDARLASSQGCWMQNDIVETWEPYVVGASVAIDDGRVTPTSISSNTQTAASLLEAEMIVDAKPFSLALALIARDPIASKILEKLGVSEIPDLQEKAPNAFGAVLIVLDEHGQDLQIVPNVSVNLSRAIATERNRKGSLVASRAREFLVGGANPQNAGMLNSLMKHYLIEQYLPRPRSRERNRADRLLLSSRSPLLRIWREKDVLAAHPMLGDVMAQPRSIRDTVSRRVLERDFQNTIAAVVEVQMLLQNEPLDEKIIEKLFAKSRTKWQKLLIGELEREEVEELAGMVAAHIWRGLKTPSAEENRWSTKLIAGWLEELRPKTMLVALTID